MSNGMTEEHKQALARGRRQAKAVRDYLEALEQDRQRGRQPSEEELRRQIDDLQAKIDAEENAAKRVELIQRRLDTESRLNDLDEDVNIDELEREFVEAVKPYSERKGITYSAWREAGVPASVLREAGVPRTRRSA